MLTFRLNKQLARLQVWPGVQEQYYLPLLQIFECLHQDIKVNGIRRVKIIFVRMSYSVLLRRERLIERILLTMESA